MALTDLEIRKLKPAAKAFKAFDGGGLYLDVSTAGTKTWRLKYRIDGKERALNLGTYPTVSLGDARKAREANRALLVGGIDPTTHREVEAAKFKARTVLFGTVMDELRAKKVGTMRRATSLRHLDAQYAHLKGLRKKPLIAITPDDLMATVKGIVQADGKGLAMAHGVRSRIGEIYRLAVQRNWIDAREDIAYVLRGELPSHKRKHHKAITNKADFANLLLTLRDGAFRSPAVKHALNLMPHLFGRSVEICGMRWDELDLAKRHWIIPGERMKSGRPHAVPLSRQALAIIEQQRPFSGPDLVFPNSRDVHRTMEKKALIKALVRLGFKGEMTAHGFRASASTLLEYELGWNPALIEDALAHKLKHNDASDVQQVYKRPEFLWGRRIKMMQDWSDFLDGLMDGTVALDDEGSNVIPFPIAA